MARREKQLPGGPAAVDGIKGGADIAREHFGPCPHAVELTSGLILACLLWRGHAGVCVFACADEDVELLADVLARQPR